MLDALAQLILSGRIVGFILAGLCLEVVALLTIQRAMGRGLMTAEILTNSAAGAALMLALGSALAHASWELTAFCLAASLVAHVCDLFVRWR